MHKKRKVCFFLQSEVGGAERISVLFGKSLDCNKFNVTFCLLERMSGSTSIRDFIPQGYTIRSIPDSRGFKLIQSLWKVLQDEKPDIVFSSMMYINTKLLALKWMFPKCRFIVRNNNYLYTHSRFQELIIRLTYWRADYVIAQTDEMAEELIKRVKLQKEKVRVLQNPIDIETIKAKLRAGNPYPESDLIKYVATGRFDYVKGFDILVKAFKIVVEHQPNATLYILGNTGDICANYYATVTHLIEELKLNDYVHCIGFQNNPYVYMKYADCFVLSSRNEGLPNVLIEALYLGTPAAATTCIPVISRIVENGINGYLAEPENVYSLADAMLKASTLRRISSSYTSASIKSFSKLLDT